MSSIIMEPEGHFYDISALFTEGITLFSNYRFREHSELSELWQIPYVIAQGNLSVDVINEIGSFRNFLTEQFKNAVSTINHTSYMIVDIENTVTELIKAIEILRDNISNKIVNDKEYKKLWKHRKRLAETPLKELVVILDYVEALKISHISGTQELSGKDRSEILVKLRYVVVDTRWLVAT